MSWIKPEEEEICRLSHPAHPHTLTRRTNTKSSVRCFAGSSTKVRTFGESIYYYCTTCDVEFHQEYCYRWPRKMTHPYHPQHPLLFSVLYTNDPQHPQGIVYESNFHEYNHPNKNIGVSIPNHDNLFDHCTWCGGTLGESDFFYRCLICKFYLDESCADKFLLPTISNPKSHHHSLVFLPRPLLHPCDACGLVERSDPSYACFQCNYVVHQSCIDLPRVIKLTRHSHRLFYTPFLSPTTVSPCRICYKPVDIKCGTYSCNHNDCSYIAHSKCATDPTVWDTKELEWESEEIDETTEDVAAFKKVGDDMINYFCHEHPLKLEKYDVVRDKDKQCQACILHIDSQDFYNCLHCDFYLHEVCANIPRKLNHALHLHTLLLDSASPQEYSSTKCKACTRDFAGFRYKCSQADCRDDSGKKFQADFRCILVPDYFIHKCHEHPLFIPISDNKERSTCERCNFSSSFHLQCSECKYVICYKCATIPDKLHSKYEEVPLTLCYGEDSDETYWCEICETKLNQRDWFYTCNKPYISIHPHCVFGDSIYMKSGYTYTTYAKKGKCVEVFSNITNTRRICYYCGKRCSSSVFFKLSDYDICSCKCLIDFLWK